MVYIKLTEEEKNRRKQERKEKRDLIKNEKKEEKINKKYISRDEQQLKREKELLKNKLDNDTIILTYKIKLKPQLNKKNDNYWFNFLMKIKKYLKVSKKIINYLLTLPVDKRKFITTDDDIVKNLRYFKVTQKYYDWKNKTNKIIKKKDKLSTAIISQSIRKYGRNEKLKKINNMTLIINTNPQKVKIKNKDDDVKIYDHSSILYDEKTNTLNIKPLDLILKWKPPSDVILKKINQVEINEKYCYVCITAKKIKDDTKYNNIIGFDFNLKPTLVCSSTGKFMGANIVDERKKFKAMRTRWQKQRKLWKVKEMGDKEYRVMNDRNHKLSNQMLKYAKIQKANISVENLIGIRNQSLRPGLFKYFLNSWQFYTLRMFLTYKAEYKYGDMRVVAINPAYTSQECSNCGERNKTMTKDYHCHSCNLKEHRDINAAINIAKRGEDRINILKKIERKYKFIKLVEKLNPNINPKIKKTGYEYTKLTIKKKIFLVMLESILATERFPQFQHLG